MVGGRVQRELQQPERSPGSKVLAAAASLGLRRPAPPLVRAAATGARHTGVLTRGGKVPGRVATSLPLPARPTRLPTEPVLRRPCCGGGEREWPRDSESSSPTPFSRALQVSGPWTWALVRGARRQLLGRQLRQAPGPRPRRLGSCCSRRCGARGAVGFKAAVLAPLRRAARPAPPPTRASGRVRGARRGPDFQLLASLSRCTAPPPRKEGKALYFPAGHGVAGHPGTCSLC